MSAKSIPERLSYLKPAFDQLAQLPAEELDEDVDAHI